MIFTLYSFKGGVGRSMALANLAECFFNRGLSVLMIDWDLEAPGLESYFRQSDEIPPNSTFNEKAFAEHTGLIDLLVKYRQTYPQVSQQLAEQHRKIEQHQSPNDAPIETDRQKRHREKKEELARRFLDDPDESLSVSFDTIETVASSEQPLTYPQIVEALLPPLSDFVQTLHSSNKKQLMLLSAGSRSAEAFTKYAEAVQEFDWLEFLAAFKGREFIEWFRGQLRTMADVVLIDSRTGVTEMGGVCTRQMADAVVAFCAPNDQNLDGVATIVRSFDTESAKAARFDRELELLVVPTRIDRAESDKLNAFGLQFSDKLETETLLPDALQFVDRPFWSLQVPYLPRFNYREVRVIGEGTPVLDDVSRDLAKAYEKIAVHMALLAPASSALRIVFGPEIKEAFPHLDRSRIPKMGPPPLPHWVDRSEEMRLLTDSLIERAAPGGSVILWGGAGCGKTALAAKVCLEPTILAAFPDGIVWLTLNQPWDDAKLREWLRICFALRKRETALLPETLDDRRFLFVVDDITNLEQLESLLQYGKSATRLLLTRDLAIATAFRDTIIAVSSFTEQQADQLVSVSSAPLDLIRDPLFADMRRWPLGAFLIRRSLDRSNVQLDNKSEKATWNQIAQKLRTQGLAAFEEPGSQDRSQSAIASIGETVRRLNAQERRLLEQLAKGDPQDSKVLQEESSAARRRLVDLNLLSGESHSGAEVQQVPTLVRFWLQNGLQTDAIPRDSTTDREAIFAEGYELLRKGTPFERIVVVAKKALKLRSYSLARRLYQLARQTAEVKSKTDKEKLKLLQEQVLCTYKDDDLPFDERFGPALALLESKDGDLRELPRKMLGSTVPDPTDTTSQETLGLAGSIYKTQWQHRGMRADLERALGFYRRAAMQPIAGDTGYTRINTAFILDILASVEQKEDPDAASLRRKHADRFREEIISQLPSLLKEKKTDRNWWYCVTLAEAYFAMGLQPHARYWLREGLAMQPNEWELESTARQFITLLRTKDPSFTVSSASSDFQIKSESKLQAMAPGSQEWQTISLLVGAGTAAIKSMMAGKTGLALSGGGFRASLFHIGVLARLAELDLLRHIEVLSCVSGGSIIGALYYLKVKVLLEKIPDRLVTGMHYIKLVEEIEQDFLAGVQRNPRGIMFASWRANLRTLYKSGYTRTTFLAELYEKIFYRKASQITGPIWLDALKVLPAEEPKDFLPRLDNWRRGAKIPVLLINATTLNTGHNWQFAASWMGEPPFGAGTVDSNELLRRLYYIEAPQGYKKMRLGQAVAASACVPGLFDPVEFRGLYPERSVRLVDGGVHDNQGTGGLLEQECTVVLVSDASGQMNSQSMPSGDILSVSLRANSILQARVREAEFRELSVLKRSSALSQLMYVHLKDGLDVRHIDWIGCRDLDKSPLSTNLGTVPEIPNNVQELLAGLRTDLDAFSDIEANALMLSGYLMTKNRLPDMPTISPVPDYVPSWNFLTMQKALEPEYQRSRNGRRLVQMLEIGEGLSFKAWKMTSALLLLVPQILLLAIPVLLIAIIAFDVLVDSLPWLYQTLGPKLFTPSFVYPTATLVVALSAWLVFLVTSGRKTITIMFTGIVMVTVGWLIARLHLWIVDPAFLHAGRIVTVEENLHSDHPKPKSYTRRNLAILLPLALVSFLGFFYAPAIAHIRFQHTALRATAATDAEDFPKAIFLWSRAVTIALQAHNLQDEAGALRGRAYANLRIGRWTSALEDLYSIPNGYSQMSDLQGEAWALRQQGDYSRAESAYYGILKVNSSDERTRQDLAYSLALEGAARLKNRIAVRIGTNPTYIPPLKSFTVIYSEQAFGKAQAGIHRFELIKPSVWQETFTDKSNNRYDLNTRATVGDCDGTVYDKRTKSKSALEQIFIPDATCSELQLSYRSRGTWISKGAIQDVSTGTPKSN
jgi:predicted acylesterase/phospholipase RssA